MQEALRDTARHKFIVLHLMGSHSNYNKRYPPEFKQFKGSKTKIERLINSYDNSILYNDFVIDSLFSMLSNYCKRHPETVASAVYLSDHAENIKEASGHTYAGSLPTANVEIPFMIWLSERYKKINNSAVELMYLRTSAPFVSDDLFHTFIHLNGISTPLLDNSGAFFAPSFHLNRKRILADGEDYDLKANSQF
jgi:heptose-I-phosphate ethanolaminephosphotransferase